MSFLKTLLSALAPFLLVIALFGSFAQVSTYAQLVPNTCPESGCPAIDPKSLSNINGKEDIARFIIRIANLVTYVVVALAVLMIVYGGFLMIIGQADTGWTIVKNCVLGVIVAILAYTIVNIIGQVLQGNIFSFSDLGF
jgi:hypothetical protein